MKCQNEKCISRARLLTTDSREWNGITRRRKKCSRCGQKYTTFEYFDGGLDQMEVGIREEILETIKQSIDRLKTPKRFDGGNI